MTDEKLVDLLNDLKPWAEAEMARRVKVPRLFGGLSLPYVLGATSNAYHQGYFLPEDDAKLLVFDLGVAVAEGQFQCQPDPLGGDSRFLTIYRLWSPDCVAAVAQMIRAATPTVWGGPADGDELYLPHLREPGKWTRVIPPGIAGETDPPDQALAPSLQYGTDFAPLAQAARRLTELATDEPGLLRLCLARKGRKPDDGPRPRCGKFILHRSTGGRPRDYCPGARCRRREETYEEPNPYRSPWTKVHH
ncbi:hypothetical protein LLH23_04875 [bacterium]|nr:hypothetical protein [bacterium]